MKYDVLAITTHCLPARGWGGAVRSAIATVAGIQELGYRTCLIASDGNREGGAVRQADAVAATGIPAELFHTSVLTSLGFGIWAIPLILRRAWVSKCLYISGVFTWPTTLAGWIAVLLRVPFAICPHGGLLTSHLEELRRGSRLRYAVYKTLVQPLVSKADLIRVSSKFEEVELLKLNPTVQTIIIPNAFPLGDIRFRPINSVTPGRRMVFVGRLERDKGILAFIQAWLEIAGPFDSLKVVGSGSGAYAAAVRDLACDARISLTGELKSPDVHDAIAEGDILVLPSGLDGSLRENFGNVVVEALAVGRPVLAASGLAWDDLASLKIGACFTHESLNASVASALRDPWWTASETRTLCRSYAEAHFNLSVVLPQLHHMIETLVRSSGRRISAGSRN